MTVLKTPLFKCTLHETSSEEAISLQSGHNGVLSTEPIRFHSNALTQPLLMLAFQI